MSTNVGSVGVELVALNSSKVIADIKSYITSLTQMEAATKKATDTINQSFTKLGSSGGVTQAVTGIKSIDAQVKTTAQTVTSSSGQMSAAFTKVGTDIDASAKKGDASLKTLNTTSKTVADQSKQVSAAFMKVGTDIDASVKKGDATLKTLNTTTKTVADGSKQLSAAYLKAGTDISSSSQKATQGLTQVDTATKTVTADTKTMGQVVTDTGTKMDTKTKTNVKNMKDLSTETTKTKDEVRKLGDESEKVTSKWDKLGSSAKTLFLGVSTLTSGVFNLYNQYDSLQDAQMQVDRRMIRAKNSTDMAQKALRDYNAAVKEGNKSQFDLNLMLDDYKDKQKAAEVATALAADVQDDLARAWKDFYINALPSGIQTLAGGVVTVKTFMDALKKTAPAAQAAGSSVDDIAGAVAGAGGAAAVAGGKFGGLGKAFAGVAGAIGLGVGALVGIVAAVAAAGAAIAAYGTNFMGFRDMVNGAGKALGDMNPIIKIIGDGLVGLAGTLGLTGETAEQTKGHFIDMALGIKIETDKMTTAYHDSLALMQRSNSVLVQDIANTVVNVTASYTKMNEDFKSQIDLSIGTWNMFIDELASGDFEGAVDIMIGAFEDIPAIFDTIVKDVGTFATDIYNGITGTFTDISKELLKWTDEVDKILVGGLEATVGLMDAIIGRIVPGWGEIKTEVTTWVTDNITTPLTTWYETIALGAKTLWGYIVGADDFLIEIGTWITTNIVDPLKTFYENGSILVGAVKIWEEIVGTATDIGTTIDSWIQTNIVDNIHKLPEFIQSKGLEIIKAVLGFNSPLESTTVSKLEEWNEAVVAEIHRLPTFIQDQAGKILDGLLKGDVGTNISKWVGSVWADIKKQFDSLIAGAQSTLNQIGSQITDTVGGASNDLQTRFGSGATALGNAIGLPDLNKQSQAPLTGKALDIDKVMNPEKYYGDTGQFAGTPATNKPIAFSPTTGAPTQGSASQQVSQNYAEVLGLTQQAAAFTNKQSSGMNLVLGNLHKNQQQMATLNQMYSTVESPTTKAPLLGFSPKSSAPQDQFSPETRTEIDKMNKMGSRFAEGTTAAGMFARPPIEELVKFTDAYKKLDEAVTNTSNTQSQYAMVLGTTSGQELLIQQGQQNRVKAMQDLETANLNAIGYNQEYANQIEQQNLLGVAYEAGLRGQEKALMDQQVALSTAQGATAKLNEQMATGVPQAIAYGKGIDEQKNALINMQLATENTRGKITELGTQLETGGIQLVAYASGYQNASLAAMNMQVEAQSLAGEIQYLTESLTSNSDILARQNMAFLEGKKSALEWGMSLQESLTASDGLASGITIAAEKLGVDLPEGFRGSNEAMQEWIEMTLGAGEAFDSFISSIQQGGAQIVSGLGDAILKGNKELNDAIDQMEEEAGFNFSSSLENAFEAQAGINAIAKSAQKMMEHMEALGSDITPEHFNELRNGFRRSIGETFEDISKEVGEDGAKLTANLLNAINQPVDLSSPGALMEYFGDIKAAMIALAGEGSATAKEFVANMGEINGIKFDKAKNSFVDLNGNLISFQDAAKIAGESTSGLASGTTAAGTAAATADPKMAAFYTTVAQFGGIESVMQVIFEQNFPTHVKTGTDAALTHFTQFKTDVESVLQSIDMSAIGGGMAAPKKEEQGGNAGAGAGAGASGDIGGGSGGGGQDSGASGFIAAFTEQMAQVPVIMNQAFSTGVANAQGSFGLLLGSIVDTFIPIFTEQMTQVSVVMNEQFTQSIANAQGSFGLLLASIVDTFIPVFTEQLLQISVIMNDTFSQAIANAQGSFGLLLASITDTFLPVFTEQMAQIAVIMNDEFKRGADNAAGYFNMLANHTSTKIDEMIGYIEDVPVAMNDNFKRGADDAAGYLNALGTIAFNVMKDVVDSTDAARQAISNLGNEVGQVNNLFEQMAGVIGQVADMVADLGQQLDALPNVERVIHYSVEVDPLPAQTGFAGGVGLGLGTAARSKALVGENGRELVMTRPIARMARGGTRESFVTNHMQEIDFTGKELTVIPLERRNSENFIERFPMFKGLVNQARARHGIPRFASGVLPNQPYQHPEVDANPPDSGIVEIGGGADDYTVAEFNALPQSERQRLYNQGLISSMPRNYDLYEDYKMHPDGTNLGGGNGVPTGSDNPADYFDFDPNEASRSDKIAPTGYGHPSYIQTSGTGSRWQGQSWNPNNWRAVKMENDPSRWKVVDVNGKNIATNFQSESGAQEWIDDHKQMYNGGGDINGGNGGVPPGTPTGNTGGDPSGGVARWGNYNSAQIQTTGSGSKWQGANPDPNTWKVTQMVDDPSKWKVVDNNGKNIATGFGAEDAARGYIEDKKAGKGYNDTSSPDFVSNPGSGSGNGGVPPGTPTGNTGGTTYTPHTDVVAHDPNPSGDVEWEGPIDKSDPSTWRAVQMVEPNPTTGQKRWKVVNKDGKNIALRFNTKAEAEEYIAKHQLAKDRGGYSGSPTEGGGTLNIPASGNGGVPPGTGTGNGGGTGTGGGVQASNLQALKFPNGSYASSATPAGATFGQTNSGRWVANQTGANIHPEDWFIEKRGSKFIIRDGDGKDVAVDFNTLADANNFINFYITDMERKNPGQEYGSTTIPLYKDKTTGKVYSQDASGKLYEQTGNYSDYTVDPGTTANPVTGGAGSGGVPGGTPTGYTPPSYVQTSGGSKWSTNPGEPSTWQIVPMTDDPSKFKIVDAQGKNVAANFTSQQEAQDYLNWKKAGSPAPGTGGGGNGGGGGGSGGGSGPGVGTTVPGYNGNFNYQINNRTLKITQGKITENTLTAADWPAADAAFFKATGLHLPAFGTGTTPGGGYTPGTGQQGDSEGSAPGWGGGTYVPSQAAYNFAPGVVNGGTGSSGGSGSGGGGSSWGGGGGSGGTGSGGVNIGGINFPPGFPFHNVPKPSNVTFPEGFPFNDTGVPAGVPTGTGAGGTGANGNSALPVGGTNTGTGTGVTQSQSIVQNSSINGQGNNSNLHFQSGTNSSLRIQNGKVVEATGIYSGYKVGDPISGIPGLPGSGGSGGSGSNLTPALAALMHQAPEIPKISSNIYDAMGIPMGNEADPLYREFGFNRILGTGGVGGNNPNTPGGNNGGSGGLNTLNRLVAQLTQFVQTLLGKTIGTKSLWESMSSITAANIGTLP